MSAIVVNILYIHQVTIVIKARKCRPQPTAKSQLLSQKNSGVSKVESGHVVERLNIYYMFKVYFGRSNNSILDYYMLDRPTIECQLCKRHFLAPGSCLEEDIRTQERKSLRLTVKKIMQVGHDGLAFSDAIWQLKYANLRSIDRKPTE